MLLTLAIVGGFLAVIPFFLDIASVHFSQQVAQTGADSAAHAAAVEYAQPVFGIVDLPAWPGRLSGTYRGPCLPQATEQGAVQLYSASVVSRTVGSQLARAAARTFADMHDAQLRDYVERARLGSAPIIAGTTITPIQIHVSAERPAELMLGDLYGKAFLQPAESAAEAFLDPRGYDSWTELCGYTPDGDEIYWWMVHFEWKVRLIPTDS